MIDTDKYEGHTPAPWIIDWSHLNVDKELMQDAPLLLAEVKRWHKVRDYILERASYPTVKRLHLKDLLNFMEEVIE